MGIKIDITDFKKKIEQVHPFSNIEIIDYESIKKPLIYKCLNCGKVHKIASADGLFSRLNPCTCKKEFNSRKEKIKFFEQKQEDLEVLEIGRVKSKVKCKKCGEVFERTTVSLMSRFDSCPNCNNRFTKQTNSIEQAEETLKRIFPHDSEYKILTYSTFHGPCQIKHLPCHFVYNGNFDSFLNSRGCPRCYRKKSKGEQKIESFLSSKKIKFIPQKTLSLEKELKRYKFDFYLPDFNVAIEYNGEQHYKEKSGFFDSLAQTQKRDNIKKEYCAKHNIQLWIIPYWDFDKIEEILSLKFNDYRNIK